MSQLKTIQKSSPIQTKTISPQSTSPSSAMLQNKRSSIHDDMLHSNWLYVNVDPKYHSKQNEKTNGK
jgi:hypothetical protein